MAKGDPSRGQNRTRGLVGNSRESQDLTSPSRAGAQARTPQGWPFRYRADGLSDAPVELMIFSVGGSRGRLLWRWLKRRCPDEVRWRHPEGFLFALLPRFAGGNVALQEQPGLG